MKMNGYSFDFVLVVHVFDEDDQDAIKPEHIKFSMKNCVQRMDAADLEVRHHSDNHQQPRPC
jgi:hypothetical protein